MNVVAHAVDLFLTMLGVTNPSGRWYLFGSGWGGNVFIGAMILTYHRFTCSIPGCHRIGLHEQELTGHSFCRKHDVIGQRERELREKEIAEGKIPTA